MNILLPLLYGEFNLNESNVYKHPEVSWKIPSEARSSVIPSKDSSDKEKEQQNTTDSNSSWDDFMNWMSSNSLWDKLK